MYLSKLASKVYLIHRRDKFRAEKILQDKAFSIPYIETLRSHVLKEIQGSKNVTSAIVEDLKTSVKKTLDVEGVFIFTGIIPTTEFIDVEKDSKGFIKTNDRMETNIPGIFAAGDCRTTP